MKRYILTGAPGSGKTSVIHELKTMGHSVIEEAATDIIASKQLDGNAEPWTQSSFIDNIIELQKQRQMQEVSSSLQFYDRSPICTYALCLYLNHPNSNLLLGEMDRIERENIYQKQVFFIENIGFLAPTEARKISFEDSLRFEKMHEETYLSFGYECIKIAPDLLSRRANKIMSLI